MTEFEIITITFSFIVGLGVAQLLSSFAAAIRERLEHPLHWLPLVWGFVILIFSVQYWFGLFDLDLEIVDWSWLWYGQLLFLAVALFLAGALILPTRESRVEGGLLADFEVHGRLALLSVTAYILGWMPANARMNDGFLVEANLVNLGLIPFVLVAFAARNLKVRSAATVVFLLVFIYAVLFVWSIPGPERDMDRSETFLAVPALLALAPST